MYHIGASGPKRSTRDHSKCDKDQCRALQQVGSKNYKPQHVKDDCQCEFIDMKQAQLAELVQEGAIPILSYSKLDGLQLQPFRPDESPRLRYIAISHVWADGLGNPNANAMRQCQLQLTQDRMGVVAKKLSGVQP